MSLSPRPLYHALIRTHHIRSRSKINRLKSAAKSLELSYMLLKSDGATPGVMYVRGFEAESVDSWVEMVKGLRYLNFEVRAEAQEAKAGTEASRRMEQDSEEAKKTVVEEVESLKDFARCMEELGLRGWWRGAMGFARD